LLQQHKLQYDLYHIWCRKKSKNHSLASLNSCSPGLVQPIGTDIYNRSQQERCPKNTELYFYLYYNKLLFK
jgi:hypothetical protein